MFLCAWSYSLNNFSGIEMEREHCSFFQLSGRLQHCDDKGDDFHLCMRIIFKNWIFNQVKVELPDLLLMDIK
jgi:hypothetical protein